jgi:DNA-binding transcriptional MerR regulator/methylmalonyl-CoA mutase cobalamin-binding subunit
MENSGTEFDSPTLLPIHAVERETGVSKELLRMWERRYGFPAPARDAQGDRIYPPEQVTKLRLLRRLLDHGFRPGKIIEMPTAELEKLLRARYSKSLESAPELERELIGMLRNGDAHQVREYLSHQMVRMGLQAFILEFLQYANTIVGDAWMRGIIEVHEEHLYTEQVQSLIRTAITGLRTAAAAPRVMLTTPPGENHTLGILMTEAMLRLDSIDAVCFGAVMPVRDIVQAAQKHRMDIVALSFSASYPSSRAIDFLEELRFRLPLSMAIWAGGGALQSGKRMVDGVEQFQDLGSIRKGVESWRQRHPRRS